MLEFTDLPLEWGFGESDCPVSEGETGELGF
jgi:hypothetical protein